MGRAAYPDPVPSSGSVRAWAARPGVRARASDLTYAVLGTVVTVTATVEAERVHGAARALGVAVLGVTAVAALVLLRRTRPMLVMLAAVPCAVVGGSLEAVLPLALFAFAVRRRDRRLAVAATLTWATFIAAGPLNAETNWASGAISGAILVALAVTSGAFLGARRDLVASLRERAEQAEATALLLQRQARLAERTRIAREMHDVVAHRISLVDSMRARSR